jgi:ribonuclease-3
MPTITSSPSKSKKAGTSGRFKRRKSGSEAAAGYPEPDPARKKVLAAFLKTAGVRFKSFGLLNLSFMHRSVSNESSQKINNERLEFLGDAVLGAAAASMLYEILDSKAEGELARIKSVVVSEDVLSAVALELQIDNLLILGRGEELSGGRTKKALLADALEALIGGVYLDSGYKNAFAFISRFLSSEIERVLENKHSRDFKSLLQEFCQQHYKNYPFYRLVKRSGPEHSRIFWVDVTVNGQLFGPAIGRNKKSAEREAARLAFEALSEKRE